MTENPKSETLESTLRRIQTRLRLREAATLVPIAATLGLAAALLLAAVGRFQPALSWPVALVAGLGLVAAAVLAVLLYAMLRPRSLMATARSANHLLSLDERLSTALEDAQTAPDRLTLEQDALWQAQLDDALDAASRVEPQRDLPIGVDRRRLLPAVALLLLLPVAMFAPLPNLDPSNGKHNALQAQVQNELKQIEELKKAIQQQPAQADDPARAALLKELDELSRDLERGDLTQEEALARLSEAESRLQEQLDPQSPAQREAMDQLAKQLAASSNPDVKDAGEKLKLGDAKKAADALKKAGENADKMTPEERKALAQSLRDAQSSVAALDPELAQLLNDAANALESGDAEAAQKALDNLSKQVEQTGQNVATQQQIQQALAQIQQSKSNVAQSSASGTPISVNGTPIAMNGTPGALGSPISGQLALTGTPVAMRGTPGNGTPGKGTPVLVQGPGGQGQGQGQGQQGQPGQGQGAPAGGWGKGHNDPVYVPPSSVNAPSTVVPVQGQNNPDGESSTGNTNTDVNNTGPSQVPYDSVYVQYQQQAGNALDNDYIPQGYKDLVRDYFTSIDPNGP